MAKNDFSITLIEYHALLKSHDWYFECSDDYRVWKKGNESLKHLRELSETSPNHKALFDAFSAGERPSFEELTKDKPSEPLFNLANLRALVSDGKIFSVWFVKRSTGELRKMICRTGVTKHLKGGTARYSASSKGLLRVYDVVVKGYRSIPVEGIQRLTAHGQTFEMRGVA